MNEESIQIIKIESEETHKPEEAINAEKSEENKPATIKQSDSEEDKINREIKTVKAGTNSYLTVIIISL